MKAITSVCALATAAASFGTLTPSYIATGNVAGELAAAANTGFQGNMTLTLSTMPIAANISQAYFYASDWNSTGSISPTFAGFNLTPSPAMFTDNNLSGYRWDVTSIVQLFGNANYSVSIPNVQQLFGCALAVVFTQPTLPQARVQLNDGAHALGDAGTFETGSTSFQNFNAGSGTLSIYTQGDDASATGETVDFNGNIVATGLDANLGATASLLNLNVNVLNGTNSVTISTSVPTQVIPVDVFGWHLAMLQSPVPEPASLTVLGLGGLALIRRKAR